MQMQQQLHKKMLPSRPIPQTEEELSASNLSMTSYMERYGGYRNNKEMGMAMWIASHAVDAAAQNDFRATKEYLSLLVIAMEQATLDGNWSVASILSLLESPPNQVFQERAQSVAMMDRPFSPLVPPSWAATALAYLKEIEVLSSRKTEIKFTKPNKNRSQGRCRCPVYTKSEEATKVPEETKGCTPGCTPSEVNNEELGGPPGPCALGSSSRALHDRAGVRSKHRDPGCVFNGPNNMCVNKPSEFRNGKLVGNSRHNSSKIPTQKSAEKVSPAHHQISYPRWYGSLVSEVLKSRTPFAAFWNSTISASKSGHVGPLAPTFFPIPMPRQGAFDRMPAHPSSSKRRRQNPCRCNGPQLLVSWWPTCQ